MKLRAILLAVFISLLGFIKINTIQAASVTPTFVGGNPTCQDLGYTYGFKPTAPSEANPSGTHTLLGGADTITITVTGTSIDWTSTLGMDAVIVKAGDGANVYRYDPPAESFGDTNLITPLNNGGQQANLSHLVFCYDYEVGVNKTANTTFARDWDWTIDKSCDQTDLTLSLGQTFNVNCSVTLDADSTDSDWAVSGVITIHNPDPTNAATVTSVTDQISGIGAISVDCGTTLPLTIDPGDDQLCTYTSALPDATSRTNTATVATTGLVGGGGWSGINYFRGSNY